MRFLKQARPRWKLFLTTAILALFTLYVLNASKPGKAVEGCPEGCAATADRSAGSLRVLSLNMLHGFPRYIDLQLRLDLIASEISRLDADVILLQEIPWTIWTGNGAKYLAEKIGYNYLYYRANGNNKLIFFEEGEAILSRFPLKEMIFTELRPRAGFFESRVSLGATAITPWGEVRLFVTHLTDKDPQVGEGQAETLRSFVEMHTEGIGVVAGDFNALEGSPQIMDLAGVWMDTYRLAHPNDPGLTCCIDDLQSGPEEALEERIDYIFLVNQGKEGGEVIRSQHTFYHPFRVGEGWQWASDHTGLMVEIDP